MDNQKCPKCGAEELRQEYNFCDVCGFELGNYCDNPDCVREHMNDAERGVVSLPDRSLFCPYCGQKTHYGSI